MKNKLPWHSFSRFFIFIRKGSPFFLFLLKPDIAALDGVTVISERCPTVIVGGGATGLGGSSFSSSSELILINSFSPPDFFLENEMKNH